VCSGSTHFTARAAAGLAMSDVVAMINMDMVAGCVTNKATVLGAATAEEWRAWCSRVCESAHRLRHERRRLRPERPNAFYAAGFPSFTSSPAATATTNKPSDAADKINGAGAGQSPRSSPILAASRRASKPSLFPQGDGSRAAGRHAELHRVAWHDSRLRRPPNGQKGVLLAAFAREARPYGGPRAATSSFVSASTNIGSVET